MKIAREKIFQSNSAVAKKISIRDFQFARTILIMDLAYLFFNYPIVIFQIAFSSMDCKRDKSVLVILTFLINITSK